MTNDTYARIQQSLDAVMTAALEWKRDTQAAHQYAASANDDIVQVLADIRARNLPNVLLDRVFVMTIIKRESPQTWTFLQDNPDEYTRAVAEIGRRERNKRLGGQ